MDDDDSTEALLAKLIEGKRIIDDAIVNLYYNERARGLSAVVGYILNIGDDSDNPPFEHDALSALLGNKRSLPLRWIVDPIRLRQFHFPLDLLVCIIILLE